MSRTAQSAMALEGHQIQKQHPVGTTLNGVLSLFGLNFPSSIRLLP